MKNAFTLLIFFYFIVLSYGMNGQGIPKELTGVWKYETEGLEGITIISPTHAAWILTKNNRPNLNGQALTTEDKIKAYNSIQNIGILTQKTEGTVGGTKRCASTYLYSNDPSRVGQSFSWEYEKKGDYFNYWIIQPDGSRGYQGKARKLADWDAKVEWSKLNGLWKYSGPYTGYYMHSGNYGLWLIINDPNLQVATDEGKAHAFDVINSAAALVQNVDNHKQVWRVLHAYDENMENQSIYTGMKAITPDLYEVWYDDGFGKPTGTGWAIQRVKK